MLPFIISFYQDLSIQMFSYLCTKNMNVNQININLPDTRLAILFCFTVSDNSMALGICSFDEYVHYNSIFIHLLLTLAEYVY